jgi:hypothetical protein
MASYSAGQEKPSRQTALNWWRYNHVMLSSYRIPWSMHAPSQCTLIHTKNVTEALKTGNIKTVLSILRTIDEERN